MKTVSQGFRLSPRQQHVWWAQRGEPSAAFAVQVRIDIEGPLDRARLAKAVEQVVARHEILRTTFPLLPSLSVPVQSVEDSAGIDWIDWSEPNQADRPFDLANGPLLRATLVEQEGERHALLLSQPALAADGASLDLLAAEIAAAYLGGFSGSAEEVLQYADLAEILHDWEGSPAEDSGPAFWRKQDLSALVRVTWGRVLPDGRPFHPKQACRQIERGPVAQAAERLETTVSAILLAGWQAALHLSTGEEEIVVGTLFDGRTFAELESALGPFARYLPVRARSTVDATLGELSRGLSATLSEVSRRQDFFSSASVEQLLAEHGAAGWPFGFDHRQPREIPAAPGVPRFRIVDGSLGLDRFGLRLSVFDDGRSLRCALVHDPALVQGDEAGRLLERFSRVLDGLLAGTPLGEIDVLTESERRQILEFNRTESTVPADLCAHHLFEEQVRRTPHAPALAHAGRTWTYAELNARANRLAHHLRALGLGPGARAGLQLERSPELVEALLGILKAGAAYVPLDPGAPAGRLSWMAEDAGLSLLLTGGWLAEHGNAISRRSADDPPPAAGPADLAYVLYTSGSTGRPKGVMVPHRGLVNYLLWARQAYAAGEGAGAPVHSAIGFDLTVTSLLVPLVSGTAVRLLDEGLDALAAALREGAGFSLVKLTPAHLDLLGRELRPEDYGRSTRALVIGGEALKGESVAPWREHAPHTRLINEYGPTEATVGCCVHEIAPGEATTGPVAIGRPIANTRLQVVGPRFQPVPPGAPGELWIGGDGLARGYLGRPDLTAERFVPDPFAEAGRAGERLYRTGDLVRLGRDGKLEFLGRIDSQIKIRGFRIEPGEVEAALAAYEGVREAAVLVGEDPGGPILVACVAGIVGTVEAGALRRHLHDRLPEAMVPSRFAVFEALPLTPNGKVDRKELARTWRERADAAAEPAGGEPPRTWTEELLAGMFAELLGLPRVGREESFFALGGHSLLATQAVSRVREAFGIEMSLRAFFEVPTVAALATRVEALRSGGTTAGVPPLVPAPREGPLPLSFAQQRLWFIDRLAPGSPLYNIPVALRVEGPLDAAILAACLGEITRRHEALRTVFAEVDGAPVQVIRPPAPFPLPVVDLSGLPEGAREAPALALAGAEAVRPFDLARGPLLRGLLLRLGSQDHIAALTMHHIVSDGWSLGLLVREVGTLYPAFAEGRPSPLPELPVQYADFAAWQRAWLHGEALERQIAFWRQQLAGLPPLLALPTDRARPAIASFRGAWRPVRLPAALVRQAQALGRREGATLFMVLLAGFQALLARAGGQQDLAVGTPVAGRNRMETEGLIGFFVNTLVLRGDLTQEPSFLELLGRVRETALAAHGHQDVPFERLIQELAPERSLAHTPLFQVMLALQNAPVASLDLHGLRLRPVSGTGTMAKFDLLLSLEEHNGALGGTAEYATDLFDATTIDRLMAQLERLLTAAVEAPERTVAELPLLPDAERHQLLLEWNDTAVDRAEEPLIHELFAAWAERTPGAVAAVCGGAALTYGELAAQAHRLAWHLRSLGAGPGSLVGLHLRRGLPMLPAVLAVLEAGAAYVPLEIGHPPARLEWILRALDISCVLTESAQLGGLPALRDVVCLDQVDLEGYEPSAPPRQSTPDDLAYIIFTSGSTGTPKGVMVRHRPVVNLLRWAYRTFDFSPADRVLFVTSLSFDLSVFDLFGLLGAGGSIRIATEDEIRDPERLLRALAEEPITFWDSAPAALEQTVPFLPGMDPQARPSLRLVFLSGDWIPVTLPDRVRERFPGARVISLGGATEATVWSNVFPIERVDPAWTSIPYGRPIENARYYVLDAHFAPCPVGVPGDLYIGGGCLADGYAREPELTASKFLPDPWSTTPGARLYRTGDRARYRPDGNLEFLGRLDHQVKIRGFRIELGEIEAALSSLPGIREAVVVVREERSDRRLVAYVVGDLAAEELRRPLQERLPDHMVPAAFVMLAALPLTPNGKVDRKALPAPEQQRAEETYIAPRTPVEGVLAGIWAELLGLERVGAADHFFDLGGHSLLATQVVSHVREAFGVELPLRDLFDAPTLAGLSTRVEALLRAGADQSTPPLLPLGPGSTPRAEGLPLSFAQQRLWFLDQLEPGTPLYNVPVALQVEGPLQARVLALCLGEIVRRHEALRTVFSLRDGAPVQVILPAAPFELPVVDLSGLPESGREAPALALVAEEAVRPFDLGGLRRGPLLRGLLLRLAASGKQAVHIAALTLHHIAGDAWSLGLLVREVTALYVAFAAGRPSPLPELPVQYADFAVWQRSWLQGEVLEREISFWRRQLAGLPPLLALPTDRPRPAVRSFRGAERPVRLPARLTRQAEALGRREGATLFMVLLAGFQAVLARHSNQRDLAVGAPVAGRNRVEIEGLIGFFVNTLVLRAGLTENPTFRELLGRTRETALAAHTHQDVPFEMLVQELAPERSLAQTPLVQVAFVLQNAPVDSVEIRGLCLRPVVAPGTTAKLDLTLNLEERNGGLDGAIKYSTDLFDATTIDRLAGHFERLLTAALKAPERPVADLLLLAAAERHQLLAEWGGAEWGGPAGRPAAVPTLHGGFEAHARQAPEAPALTWEGVTLSYGELNRRSNQLARWLREQGVGPESRVGLRLERSLDLVVGLLGVLKAGGAYVPLPPASPRERLAWMAEDAGVRIVVEAELLEAHRATLAGLPDGDLAPLAAGSNLAYVIYTSGSTGRPKGVLVSHGNAVRLFDATRERFGFAERDVWTLFHSYAFDFSVWEIWGALLHGGRLVIVPYEVSRSPGLFLDLLVRERVTVLNQTPSAFTQLARVDEERGDVGGIPADLRLVIFGGEALDPAGLAPWFGRHGDERPRLVNMYGITETTVHVTWRTLHAADARARRSLVGAPLPGWSLAVMDPDLRPAPIGVPGELVIGGAGLARGYLGRPELTAERFVPDPHGQYPGARLYRSGDLGRFLPCGDVEFLGRIDHQVKIRGFRIEPGEIEAALTALPGVREAVVMASNQRLVAYVAGDLPADALRQSLRERLPDYMVPAVFVRLAALPLTPQGKVDRKALPAPEQRSDPERHQAPRTPLEEFLAGLWREALGVDSVGLHDSFFDLGGSSISGVILINRLQKEVGGILHVVVLFDAPTVAKMAAYLAREHRETVLRLWGPESLGENGINEEELGGPVVTARRVDAAQVATFRALIPPLAPSPGTAAKNPPAVFLLSPPRSGSTLLRVLLGGHPRLFAPPELELLSFNTLADREAAFPGRDSFWLEGAIRAVLELRGGSVEEARRIIRACTEEGWTTQRFYRQLQDWLGGRILIDKTPSYALDPAVLRRAEETFERPFYIHLVRHPYAVVRSFEEARLDQIFFRHPHPFRRTELAELIWLVSHQNIADLLAGVPAERQLRVLFEDLVRDPEAELRRICAALEIDYHPGMADPYRETRQRMTDGLHAEGRMLGDVKFFQHQGVEARVADRWREAREGSLGEPAWEMAVRFGYERPAFDPIHSAPVAVAIPRAGRGSQPVPVSSAQQRLWFIDQLEPGSPLYNIPVALRVEGPLDPAVLALCLGEIVRRHEALRTVFAAPAGAPVQVVQPAAPFRLPVADLSGLPEGAREATALALAGAEAARPFDLRRGPLLRGLLVRLGEEDHTIALTLHHIVSDGWSMGILVREVTALYAAFAEGRPSPLFELPLQYADFSVWQRSWLHGEILENEVSFWRRQLAGLPPLLALPTDRPRPAVQSFRGTSRPVRLPAGLGLQAQAFGRSEEATLFLVLLAAFQALLARLSGQQDLAVGTPVSGRNREEIEGLIGFFVNTLVLRGDLTGEPTFRELLGRVRETALAAQAHQDVPFEKLVQELAPERSLAHAPLFQVMFALQNAPVGTLEIRNLRLRPMSGAVTTAKSDLALSLEEHGGALGGSIELATDLFDTATIQRWIACFERLLAGALADPDRPVADLPLLSEAELHQVRIEWNPTGPAPGDTLVDRFESWVDRTPDAVAVTVLAPGKGPGEALTYAELDRRANQLARRLRALGVAADSRVGLCAERSPEMIVAVLGILKAGAAYVPLDPAYPRERLAFMLEDARVPVLLTQERLLGSLPETAAAVLLLDGDEGGGSPSPGGWVCDGRGGQGVRSRPLEDSLAYVIYTSGSTGRPKGVMAHHRGLSNLAEAQRRLFALRPGARVLQFASLSFDASAWEMALAFGAGATLLLGPRERRLSAEELMALLRESTLATLPPTALAVLEPEELPGLEILVVGGEACPPELARRWSAGRRFFHGYGPTEAAVCATAKLYDGGERLPIGRPLDRVEAWVMDARGNPVPAGIVGELCLGGPGLARGYLHLPERTARSFVPHPFATLPGERLYRTGDLAHQLPNGDIEILGRTDHQVKVRGFRIEPGEIEAALSALPGVREAAVVVREDKSAGDRRLVAYVAGDATADALRQSLRERLPDYMVPAVFVMLAALPLTANGKVDRKALPAPEEPQGAEESWLAPRTQVEEVLAGIWAELLGRERVGAADHFFDLGGHSLLATRVMSRLRSAFGIEMPLRDLFEAPRLADLAVRVEAALLQEDQTGAGRLAPPLVPLAPSLRERPLPLSFAQQRLWFIAQLEPGSPLYNIAVALRVEGPLDPAVLALCLGEIVRRHEALRTVFTVREGAPVQVIRPAVPFELPVVDLSGLAGSERAALTLAAEEAGRPFDLERGPVFRGALFRLAEAGHLVALTLHHIAGDGWSMGILVREVTALYAAFAAGKPSPLAELPVQYADFAAWQGSWLRGAVLQSEIAFWRRQLAGLPPRLELPTDRPRPAVQSFRGASRPVRLPAGLAAQAQALGRREGATLFMVLLAGFQTLLARLGGQEDLAVGTPVAGRNRVETEGLIGFFVNTLVLRGDLHGTPSFRELVGRARETTLAAHLHQDVPFEKLVQELSPERSLAHTPLFQVMLALQNAPVESLEIQGLRLRPVGGAARTAKFDLTLSFEEREGELGGAVEHATDLFDATTVDRLTGHFERLLAVALAEPERPAAELPLLTGAELHQLLAEWNDTAAPPAQGLLLHALFEAQAARTPDAPAVLFAGETLTYAELDARADRLARHLRGLGCGPESRAGVALERSLDLPVALLGVLKAGAAYVPLDPGYPRERLAFVLESSAPRVLITQTSLLAVLPPAPGEVLCLDDEPIDPHAFETADRDRGATIPIPGDDRQLAYVLYTSGSTGRPKGVAVPHRALVRFLAAMRQTPGFAPGERLLAITSLAFDIAALEIFLPLTTGGCVELASREEAADGALLAARLRASGAGVLQATPATWRMLLDAGWTGDPGLRALCGGEALPRDLAAALAARTRELWNLYGPTETTVWSAAARLRPDETGPVSIGRPIAGTRIHLLDRELQTVPLGVPGELWIGGAGLARGYLGRPDLTAERFLPDPFAAGRGEPGARLYRTGDLARHLPGGRMEVLGRIDHQVKLRGFRIELGEIEAALIEAGAREAVVILSGDRLVAYVVGDGTQRQALRERLPDYMVPAVFVTLPALPLTPNGKVDRKALPPPEQQDAGESWLAPRTPVEELLAGIWAELLGRERVGAADDFFALGGHSLLATQVVSRLRGVLGIELPLRALFEAPRLADLAARAEAALLQGDRAGAGRLAPPLLPLSPARRKGDLPPSFSQQRLWLLDQLEPGSPLFNMRVALRVQGPLDAGVLARCLGEIVRRHEALRTVFAAPDGTPVQRIQPAAPRASTVVDLPVVDLSGLPEGGREAAAVALAGEEGRRPFDLTRGPLLRSLLLRLTGRDHVIALTLHHIASDGWSMGLLVREITALYTAFAAGRPSPLPELPVQYADFAVWQRTWLRGTVLEEQLAWWKRQLAGAPPSIELPMERSRPAVPASRGDIADRLLSPELCRQIEELGRREGTTPFMTLLAALAALLYRYTGQDDLVVGTPIAGRTRAETEGLIGFFLNTLALRVDLSGDPTVRELLGRVRETTVGASDHQDVPFELLLEELRPERDLSRTPLFQIVLNWLGFGTGQERIELPELVLEWLPETAPPARFDLEIYAGPSSGGQIFLRAVYNRDLLAPSQIEDLLTHLEALLAAMVAAPGQRLSALPPAAGQHESRRSPIAAAGSGFPAEALDGSIPERFAAMASAHAGRPAVVAPEGTWTYAELAREADRVTHAVLSHHGVPGGRIALLFSPEPAMVAAVLGTLAAGAAYVPLDPSHPRERLLEVLADSGAALLLAGDGHRGLAAGLATELPVLVFGDLPPAPPGSPAWAPPPTPPEAPAYLLYTSGSTGRPKGVVQSHRNVLGHIRTYSLRLGLEPEDRLLLLARYGFDAAVMDLYGALLNGATLSLWDLQRDGLEGLGRWIAEQAVTVYHSTPSVYRAFLDSVRPGERWPDLRLVVLGGEEARRQDLERFRAAFPPGCRLVNGLGPTESTLALQRFLDRDTQTPRANLPIGWPVEEVRVRLRNRAGEQPALWGAGEIEICSPFLALGYWGQPDLTAERFVPDPEGPPGARRYRTGDLARRLPEGELEFLGRADGQVKVRGHRIETGEIEAALVALSGVRQAAVVAREDRSARGPGDLRLVAYVAGDVEADALRRALRDRLPDALVPAAFVILPALPLTPNGKLDRRSLPAPEQQRSEKVYLAPRTPAEETLARLWAELLVVERVGASDHFFELGGHSLLATRLVAAIRNAFRVEVPLRAVFEQPTLEGLARLVAEMEKTAEMEKASAPVDDRPVDNQPVDDRLAPLPRHPGENRFPVSFSQLREWILDRLEPGNPAYNIPSPLRIEGPLAIPVLTEALRALVRRHEVFRTRFAAGPEDREPEPFQIVLPEVRLDVPVIDLSALPESVRSGELRRQARDEAATGFDLSIAPLLRSRIVRLAPEDHALLLTVHHIIADGWSMGILRRELAILYEAIARRSPASLPPLPVQYADYAVWQRRRLAGAALEQQTGFWRRRLAGAPPLLELPTDRPRPPVRSSRSGKVPFHLPPPLSRSLQELARRHGTTLFMVVLAGYQTLLGRWSGQDDVVVGTYSGNRPRRELEPLIGFFINTLVLRTALPEDASFAALLAQVRETTLEAYAHADIPFEKLLETMQLPRDPSRTPLFQALLVLQNFPPTRAELSTGVRLSALAAAGEKVDYDLELWLGESADGLAGALSYSAALFDEATLTRFAGQLRTLLEAAAAGPERNLWSLPLITGNEQALQLQAWSRGPAVPPGPPLLHRLVEEQAARTPGAVALEAGGLRLTYAELIEQASLRARTLSAEGIGPGTLVALTAGRTPDLIVSMLAVLQAGAAYLPLDPTYPQERRDYMLRDSEAVPFESFTSLTSLGSFSSFSSFSSFETSPAYVIYTSGSTGLPKGVVVPHHAIASFVRAARESYHLAPGDRVLQFASLGFDTSAEEIWPALAAGATLVLRPDDMAESIPHFLRELKRLGITVLDLPTAFWHELVTGLEAEDLELPPDLRLLILGGEEALADRFALWHRRIGSAVRLVNTYGPTETTIVATRRELSDLAPGALIPIGRPIPGARTYVLDRFFTPVPPGVRGELWIGGAGVARGYLGRPELTAERFVPDPFAGPADTPGARLYRTGDLAVLRPDGDLLFAGRADRQLKIRGYRVEPGEIEAALRLHPALRDAVADARGTGDARRLIAWIVPSGDEAPGAADLRAFLRTRLPDPLVPAVYVQVAALPLTPSGKVDRRALPEPAETRPEGGTYAEPQSALERTIAEIYRDLLRIARIGLHDNFFDLGGHSLLIVRAHQKLKQALGREIPVLDLFRFPTVATLARHLGGEETGNLQKVQGLAEQQRAAQQRQKAAMERLRRPGGPGRR